jgi:hypothetical protein
MIGPSRLAALALASALVVSCANDRPTDAAWQMTWQRERTVVPDAAAFLAGGRQLCDGLVAELKSTRDELDPTPTEALDDAVDAWVSHAETLAFECTQDTDLVASRMNQLDVLAAEIDAGLAADEG